MGLQKIRGINTPHFHWKFWAGKRFCPPILDQVTWRNTGGSQLGGVPTDGELPPAKLVRFRNAPLFYGGFEQGGADCYTAAFWGWPRWEEEIDWMALQGVNLPVAPVGQEAIFRKVYLSLGLSESEIESYFTGPAFLAWNRLGNIRTWAGPLTPHWHTTQSALQAKILERMRQLGMAAVLPAFHGHVPDALAVKFPQADTSRLSSWGGFTPAGGPAHAHGDCCSAVMQLEPTSSLFAKIGEMFVRTMRTEWPAAAASHMYHPIVYEEEVPWTNNVSYLAAVSKAVYGAISAVDPEAVWLVQGWTLHNRPDFWKPPQAKAFLGEGRIVVLDLFAEGDPGWLKTQGWWGTPWIWCMLHDMGQNYGMYGKLDTITAAPLAAAKANATMVGQGMVPEGFEQNPNIYELFSEVAFEPAQIDPEGWSELYAHRRMHMPPPEAVSAWIQLYTSGVFNCKDEHENHNHDWAIVRPRLFNDSSPDFSDGYQWSAGSWPSGGDMTDDENKSWYRTSGLVSAWQQLLSAGDVLDSQEPFKWDLVDITREVLGKLVLPQLVNRTSQAYLAGDVEGLQSAGAELLGLFDDLDEVLSSCDGWLLGPWLQDARLAAAGDDHAVADRWEYNARAQITLWGGTINDYANKYWGGMIKGYYRTRWVAWLQMLTKCIGKESCYSDSLFSKVDDQLTEAWVRNTTATDPYPTQPSSRLSSLMLARAMLGKYRQLLPQPSLQ